MSKSLRLLILEDNPADAKMMVRELRRAGFEPDARCVHTEPEYLACLDPSLDLILADHGLPQFDALRALGRLRERGLDIPFVIVSGSIVEDLAVSALKQGAADYLLKDRLARLGPAVTHALEQKRLREEKRRAEQEREQLLTREQAARAEAEAAVERLRAIQTITDAALRYLALDDSLRELLGRTRAVLSADIATILLLTEDGQHLVFRASHGLETDAGSELRIPVGSGIAGRIASEGKAMILEDPSQVEALSPALGQQIHSLIGAPLLVEERAIGVVLVGTGEHGRFTGEDLHLLQLVADRAASVIEHAHLFDQVRAGRERSQMLSQQLMEAQEMERRHLARELHDEIGQALTAVKINLQAVQRSAGGSAGLPRLEESVSIVDRALQQVRNLSLDLRPSLLDDLGLVAALRWYLDRQAQRAGFAVEFVADPPGIRASPSLETACFRVAQEALTNVVRHAQAKKVRVELRQRDPELHLVINDDGVGFEVAAARQRAIRGGSLGLLGMQERVLLIRGRIDIKSEPGHGTSIHACFPLATQPSLERRSKKRESS